jgi:hypothetical protein
MARRRGGRLHGAPLAVAVEKTGEGGRGNACMQEGPCHTFERVISPVFGANAIRIHRCGSAAGVGGRGICADALSIGLITSNACSAVAGTQYSFPADSVDIGISDENKMLSLGIMANFMGCQEPRLCTVFKGARTGVWGVRDACPSRRRPGLHGNHGGHVSHSVDSVGVLDLRLVQRPDGLGPDHGQEDAARQEQRARRASATIERHRAPSQVSGGAYPPFLDCTIGYCRTPRDLDFNR